MKIEEEDPFGIKNEQLRAIVKAKFERGENFHYRWVPLECIRQVDRLRAIVMKGAKEIRCPTLVVHAREDELTSLRSANFLVEQIGGGRARMVVLEDSYHMICVDNDREIVAKNVLEFFGAALPGATSALANEPKMTRRSACVRRSASLTESLAAGDFAGLRDARHPRPRVGAAGRQQDRPARMPASRSRAFASRMHAAGCAALHRVRHAGLQSRRRAGAGDACRAARRRGARIAGRAAVAWHGGKLLEARWFADDVEREDAFFGPPEPAASGPSDARSSSSTPRRRRRKTLKKAPDNDTLLALYSLYKQASVGRRDRRASRARSTWSTARNTTRGRSARAWRATTR